MGWVQSTVFSVTTKGRLHTCLLADLKFLLEANNMDELVGKCITICNLVFKWYRHQEVQGVCFNSVFDSMFINKQDSRPLGPRVLLNLNETSVCSPDG